MCEKGRCGRRERIGAEKRADGVREEGGRRISDQEGGGLGYRMG